MYTQLLVRECPEREFNVIYDYSGQYQGMPLWKHSEYIRKCPRIYFDPDYVQWCLDTKCDFERPRYCADCLSAESLPPTTGWYLGAHPSDVPTMRVQTLRSRACVSGRKKKSSHARRAGPRQDSQALDVICKKLDKILDCLYVLNSHIIDIGRTNAETSHHIRGGAKAPMSGGNQSFSPSRQRSEARSEREKHTNEGLPDAPSERSSLPELVGPNRVMGQLPCRPPAYYT